MRKIFTLTFILLFFASVRSLAQTTIAGWTFEGVTFSPTASTSPTLTAGSFTADAGSQTAGSAFTGFHASSSTVWSSPAGNGSAKSESSNNWAINDYYQFQAATTGYGGISITFDQTGSNTGPANFKVQYSTDGTTFSDFAGNTYTIPSNAGAAISWSAGSSTTATTMNFDLSSISAVSNASAVYFRLVDVSTTAINGTTVATGGTDRVDNFTVKGTAPTAYYSKSTGNLDLLATWGTNPDGSGTAPANFTAGSQIFNVRNNTAPVVGASWTVSGSGSQVVVGDGTTSIILTVNSSNTFTINNSAGLLLQSNAKMIFNPLAVFSVGTGSTADFNNQSVTLKSSVSGTAIIGQIVGTINNATNVTVERYFSNRRSWRLLGIPFSTSSQTIKASWMEGAASSSSNPNPTYGTHITTYTGDPNAANFDAQKPASSIRIYSADNFNSDATHTPNTTNLITANQAYFLFVRGDRSIDISNATAHTTATLRITGTPVIGNVTKGVAGTSFSLIPNPYPSSINFDSVKAISANSGITTFYVWDATLGTVGQFRTITISGSSPAYTYTASPGSQDNNWRFIESGAAFMIPGNNMVSFNENTKSANTPPSSMFRTTTASNQPGLAVNLNIINADNTVSLADGVREIFDNTYSVDVDDHDAKKIQGFELNLGIATNNQILSVEKRPFPNSNDVITLQLSQTVAGNYQFEIQPSNLSSSPAFIYLRDNYLNTYTSLSLTGNTIVNFSITSDAASFGENRFSIVFSKAAIVSGRSLITIYPNPVQGGSINLMLNNMPKGLYNVRLLNSLGQTVLSKQINHAEGTSTETINVNQVKGAHLIEVTKPDNSKFLSKIIIN